MTLGSDVYEIIRKIFLVSDELKRLSSEMKDLTSNVKDHDIRLAVIETTLSIAQRSSKLILPGN
ncbi:hypothetical protein [Granulicella tundricola]|uniref:Uncharacterized protein n=1 Tax=Granulicella tundricola (strain ATCC BAA-1859 / DSM 23138 / MP5ACTX9) TaxID=1198114 RepID=E8X562_GRATM|nr:hypothetical protein [Granulicella tundricola]ADW68326.1 hypothetical protein AciX9_1264 [Granulicella tundricola MP5ACTX9]